MKFYESHRKCLQLQVAFDNLERFECRTNICPNLLVNTKKAIKTDFKKNNENTFKLMYVH